MVGSNPPSCFEKLSDQSIGQYKGLLLRVGSNPFSCFFPLWLVMPCQTIFFYKKNSDLNLGLIYELIWQYQRVTIKGWSLLFLSTVTASSCPVGHVSPPRQYRCTYQQDTPISLIFRIGTTVYHAIIIGVIRHKSQKNVPTMRKARTLKEFCDHSANMRCIVSRKYNVGF